MIIMLVLASLRCSDADVKSWLTRSTADDVTNEFLLAISLVLIILWYEIRVDIMCFFCVASFDAENTVSENFQVN